VAGGVAWLLNQLRPVFHSVRTLTEVTALPVLASISRTWVDRHRLQRRVELYRFAGGTLLLLVTFGIIVVIQGTGMFQRVLG
jgi:hypothetical protein